MTAGIDENSRTNIIQRSWSIPGHLIVTEDMMVTYSEQRECIGGGHLNIYEVWDTMEVKDGVGLQFNIYG